MSANTTAGRPAIAPSSRAVIAARSHPVFDTATSPCWSPAMDCTAATNALPTSACAKTTPISGSLIVLFEVFLQRLAVPLLAGPLLAGPRRTPLHPRDQPLVELARRVGA